MSKSPQIKKAIFKKTPETKKPELLNPEQIAARRVPIEDVELNLGKNGNWQCHYCSRRFMGEGTFMRHHCEPKRRAEELINPIGQAAFGYYREWMRKKKFSQPAAAAFMESKYYRAFINFAQMIIDANIARPEIYMDLMIAGSILPILWCRDSAYAIYLEWSEKLVDPLEQVQDSVNYLFDICEKENIKISNIFVSMGAQRVLSLIRQRRLTPWLLFCSPKFGDLLRTLDKSQLIAFNSVVNGTYWSNKFQSEKSTIIAIKEIVAEVGL
jgi:hypothetical protein